MLLDSLNSKYRRSGPGFAEKHKASQRTEEINVLELSRKLLNINGSVVLNRNGEYGTLENILEKGTSGQHFMASDVDKELMIKLVFAQPLNLTNIGIWASSTVAKRTVFQPDDGDLVSVEAACFVNELPVDETESVSHSNIKSDVTSTNKVEDKNKTEEANNNDLPLGTGCSDIHCNIEKTKPINPEIDSINTYKELRDISQDDIIESATYLDEIGAPEDKLVSTISLNQLLNSDSVSACGSNSAVAQTSRAPSELATSYCVSIQSGDISFVQKEVGKCHNKSQHVILYQADPSITSRPTGLLLYANRPDIDFNEAMDISPDQTVTIDDQHIHGEKIPLRGSRFQRCTSMQIFIAENINNTDRTFINGLALWGFTSPSYSY